MEYIRYIHILVAVTNASKLNIQLYLFEIVLMFLEEHQLYVIVAFFTITLQYLNKILI